MAITGPLERQAQDKLPQQRSSSNAKQDKLSSLRKYGRYF